jgi:2'-5' RNA ligase
MSEQRLFVAIEVPETVRGRIVSGWARVRSLAPDAKWVDAAAMHITLVFLGDVDTARIAAHASALASSAGRHQVFGLRIASAHTFGGRHPRVLAAGIEGDLAALTALYHAAVDALVPLGFEPPDRPFVGHLTLARARGPRGDVRLAACAKALADDIFGDVAVDALVLFASELTPRGPIHTPVARLPLAALRAPFRPAP